MDSAEPVFDLVAEEHGQLVGLAHYLFHLAKPNPLRAIGALCTYLGGCALAVALWASA